jgi:hypothetical protein
VGTYKWVVVVFFVSYRFNSECEFSKF